MVVDSAFLTECRTDIEEMLEDTCDIKRHVSSGSNSRGGTSGNQWDTLHSNVPCRVRSLPMKISMGEAEIAHRARSEDEMILTLPWDYELNNKDRVDVTTRDGETFTLEITQQMRQTSAFSRVFGVLRIS